MQQEDDVRRFLLAHPQLAQQGLDPRLLEQTIATALAYARALEEQSRVDFSHTLRSFVLSRR